MTTDDQPSGLAMSDARISDQDNALLRAWRRGELTEEAAQAFEQRLFLEPELLRAVETDQALAAALRDAPTPAVTGPSVTSLATARERARPVLPLLLAASLGAVASLPVAWRLASGPEVEGQAHSIEWVDLSVRRGAGPRVVEVAPEPGTQMVALQLTAPGAEAVDIELVAEDGTRSGLRARAVQPMDGLVSIAFARDALVGGRYRVRMFSTSTSAPVSVADDWLLHYRP